MLLYENEHIIYAKNQRKHNRNFLVFFANQIRKPSPIMCRINRYIKNRNSIVNKKEKWKRKILQMSNHGVSQTL